MTDTVRASWNSKHWHCLATVTVAGSAVPVSRTRNHRPITSGPSTALPAIGRLTPGTTSRHSAWNFTRGRPAGVVEKRLDSRMQENLHARLGLGPSAIPRPTPCVARSSARGVYEQCGRESDYVRGISRCETSYPSMCGRFPGGLA